MGTSVYRRYKSLTSTGPDGLPVVFASDEPAGAVIVVRVGGRPVRFRLTDTVLDGGWFAAEEADRYM